MSRELTIKLGVLAEKRRPVSRWVKEIWVPVGVMPPSDGFAVGHEIMRDEERTRYFMGVHELTVHATETEAYVHNFNATVPALFVALRRTTDPQHPLPWFVHVVTASPYLAQDLDDSGEEIVERVAMPPEIESVLKDFCNRHHTEEVFKKRRRDKVDMEEQLFGKEPIFERPGPSSNDEGGEGTSNG